MSCHHFGSSSNTPKSEVFEIDGLAKVMLVTLTTIQYFQNPSPTSGLPCIDFHFVTIYVTIYVNIFSSLDRNYWFWLFRDWLEPILSRVDIKMDHLQPNRAHSIFDLTNQSPNLCYFLYKPALLSQFKQRSIQNKPILTQDLHFILI